ncbi:Peptidase S24-like protein [anaerobic digester metagenome]
MSPTIQNGDMVLINQGQREVIAGAIYAIGVDDSVLVKRLDKRPGKIVLVSDNRDAYAPQELDMTDEIVRDSLRVIGRVLWWCREA